MSESPGRYQSSPRGMLAALVVLVVGVTVFVGLRGLGQDNVQTPVQTVDYHGWVKSGRADGKLDVMVPAPMPRGWRATSVSYITGSDPRWHLGMLTDKGRYVGIEESWASPREMVQQYVDANAHRGKAVSIDGRRWQVWTDQGGDYALVDTRPSRLRGHPETVLVVGDADPPVLQQFVGSLSGR
ncbi:MAG TPA: DUF4245 domain-containing protein [Marmoricola sp.]|nr:DUF4245 domain-containing protein [Marmoricola sp.]